MEEVEKFLHWDKSDIENEGVIEFWEQIVKHTEKWLKSVHTRDSGLHYWGAMNVHTGHYLAVDLSKPVVVLWHSVNESYSELAMRALMEHFKVEFAKVDGLEWTVEGASGNGGVLWMVINLTDSTKEALESVYEEWVDCSPIIDNESAYYAATETHEYEQMRQDEEEYAVREWITWELYHTPFESWDRDDMPSYVSDEWGNGNVYYEEYDQGTIYFGGNDEHEILARLVLDALNNGFISVAQEELDDFYEDNKKAEKWLPYRIRRCGVSGKWSFESEMDFINDEWLTSPSVGPREIDSEGRMQSNLPGIDDVQTDSQE
jgi:hypothetical protein